MGVKRNMTLIWGAYTSSASDCCAVRVSCFGEMKRTFRLAEGFHAFGEACDGHWNHAVAAENLLDHVNRLGVGPVCL